MESWTEEVKDEDDEFPSELKYEDDESDVLVPGLDPGGPFVIVFNKFAKHAFGHPQPEPDNPSSPLFSPPFFLEFELEELEEADGPDPGPRLSQKFPLKSDGVTSYKTKGVYGAAVPAWTVYEVTEFDKNSI